MQILDDVLYILIEGEPESPEVAFINRVIGKLISQGIIANINYDVVEVGGGANFNSIAKIIYSKSNIHKHIPVLAISDKDFRTQAQVHEQHRKTDNDLIQNKSTRILYWERHEWENFILEETATIANILNQIPTQEQNNKPFRKNDTNILTKEQLDKWLILYFQNSLIKELVECLRFRFRQTVNQRLTLEKPSNTSLSLPDIEIWFRQQIAVKAREYRSNIRNQKDMFTQKIQEMLWQNWLTDPNTIDFNQAKTYFRGKEALKDLFGKAVTHLSIQKLHYETFINDILLPELEKDVNSVIVQQINLMLTPYFKQVTNLSA